MNCWRWSRRLIASEASLSDLIDYAMFVIIIIIITLSLADKYMRCALAISACSWCIAVFSLVCVNCPRLRQNNIRFSLPLGFFQFDIEFPCCLQLTANNCCCYKKKNNRLAKEIASSHLILPLKVVQYAWACCWCCCCYCSCSCCRCCFLPRQHLMATTFYFAKLFA